MEVFRGSEDGSERPDELGKPKSALKKPEEGVVLGLGPDADDEPDKELKELKRSELDPKFGSPKDGKLVLGVFVLLEGTPNGSAFVFVAII